MGGLSCIFQPYAAANNPRLSGDLYDPDQDCSDILYLDVNSMYPAVSQPLPVNGGAVHELPEDSEERLRWLDGLLAGVDCRSENEDSCHLLVVDYDFPPERRDDLDWAPPAKMTVPEELLSEHTRNIAKQNDLRPSKVEKLVPFLDSWACAARRAWTPSA